MTLKESFEFEKSQNGVLVDSIKSFGILRNPHMDVNTLDKTKAYIFKRINDNFSPQLHVWYHFDNQTKKMKGVRYTWGLYNPSFNPNKERDFLEVLTKKEKEFMEKHSLIKDQLIKLLGVPSKSTTLADNEQSFIAENFWISSEKIVGLSIRFERELVERPGIGLLSDFHIEVMTTFR